MTIDDILGLVRNFEGTFVMTPSPGDGTPDVAWGDSFIYYAPDGTMPAATQPFATVVTKDYPGDDRSDLDRHGTFRLNIGVGRAAFVERLGHDPQPLPDQDDAAVSDTLMAHPVYGSMGWVAVVNPGPKTEAVLRELLRRAYELARSRYERRGSTANSSLG